MNNVFNEDFQDFIKALNQCQVEHILVGDHSVILHGYSRTAGDLDLWINKTAQNYLRLAEAFRIFGMPVFDMTEQNFLKNPDMNVFTFGRPPRSIDIMTAVKGLQFYETYTTSKNVQIANLPVRLIQLSDLIKAKKASGRHKDLNDIENLS